MENELLNINSVDASFVLTAYNDKIYVSARSIDNINVQLIMERMGGGGHMNMAGAKVNETMDKTVYMLKEAIKKHLELKE